MAAGTASSCSQMGPPAHMKHCVAATRTNRALAQRLVLKHWKAANDANNNSCARSSWVSVIRLGPRTLSEPSQTARCGWPPMAADHKHTQRGRHACPPDPRLPPTQQLDYCASCSPPLRLPSVLAGFAALPAACCCWSALWLMVEKQGHAPHAVRSLSCQRRQHLHSRAVRWHCSELQLPEDGPLLDAFDTLDAIQDLQQVQPPTHTSVKLWWHPCAVTRKTWHSFLLSKAWETCHPTSHSPYVQR